MVITEHNFGNAIRYCLVHSHTFPDKEATKLLEDSIVEIANMISESKDINDTLDKFYDLLGDTYYNHSGADYSRGLLREGYLDSGLQIPKYVPFNLDVSKYDDVPVEAHEDNSEDNSEDNNKALHSNKHYKLYADSIVKLISENSVMSLKRIIVSIGLNYDNKSTKTAISKLIKLLVRENSVINVFEGSKPTFSGGKRLIIYSTGKYNHEIESDRSEMINIVFDDEDDEKTSGKGAQRCTEKFLSCMRANNNWYDLKQATDGINAKYNKSYDTEQIRRALRHLRDDKKPPLVESFPEKGENEKDDDKSDAKTVWRWIQVGKPDDIPNDVKSDAEVNSISKEDSFTYTDRIFNMIDANPTTFYKPPDFKKSVGCSLNTVHNILNVLVDKKRILKVGASHKYEYTSINNRN